MINLYHTSTKQGLTSIIPKNNNHFGIKFPQPVVWAVEKHSKPLFLFPQNCPRISFRVDAKTSSDDRKKFKEEYASNQVIIIESKWYEILQNQPLYQYELNSGNFNLEKPSLGLYSSLQSAEILNQKLISNPIAEIISLNIELKITPSLWKTFDYLSKFTYQTFFINLKNASPRMIFD
ncbi:DUF6886 family protein [Flexithrix dorotheae]|uniref:DUF6886 family protein n=1 Tax=Flexithrix dorotheae TaxID=70993 RepID=UPI000360336B|nr:DUF6886 family protein [Flexithrix dorotheae]